MATISSVTIRPESGKPIRISVNGVQQSSAAKKPKLETQAKKATAPIKSAPAKSTPSKPKSTVNKAKSPAKK